jgi:hypothetical protein
MDELGGIVAIFILADLFALAVEAYQDVEYTSFVFI